MNVALNSTSFVIAAILFIAVGTLVARLTIQKLAGFKPRYLDTFTATFVGIAGAYLLGSLISLGFARLRLNFTVLLLGLMILLQITTQAAAYAYIARERGGRRLHFVQGCAVTICVLGVGAAVLLIWSWLRSL